MSEVKTREPLLTPAEVAHQLGIDKHGSKHPERHVLALARRNELACKKIGKYVMFEQKAVDEFLGRDTNQ